MINEKSERFFLWQRNVVDKYKDLPTEEIKNDLQKNALPAAVLCQNLEQGFNIGTIMRSANAFGIVDFYYYGKKHFDARGRLGVQNYLSVHYLSQLDQIKELKSKYQLIALENNITRPSHDIRSFVWPKNTMWVIGEENAGITNDLLDICDYNVYIPMRGSVRSFNAASAASMAMFDYISKYKEINE